MNTIFKQFAKQTQTLSKVPKYNFQFPTASPHTITANPGLTAKRIIKCVGERLRAYDLGRWEGVPITFQTHWRDESGHTDVSTAIHIHDALEKEFGIDIKDRQVLITDIETAFYIVTSHHDPL